MHMDSGMKEQTDCPSSLLHYWGKADPGYPGEPKWHPLVYHCLDVAAVGVEYMERAPAQRRLFAVALGDEARLAGMNRLFARIADLEDGVPRTRGDEPLGGVIELRPRFSRFPALQTGQVTGLPDGRTGQNH